MVEYFESHRDEPLPLDLYVSERVEMEDKLDLCLVTHQSVF